MAWCQGARLVRQRTLLLTARHGGDRAPVGGQRTAVTREPIGQEMGRERRFRAACGVEGT